MPCRYFIILKDMELSKSFGGATIGAMGMAEDAFERLRRIAFEGEHVERMAALGVRMKLSPGVIKTLMRLAKEDGVSMGEMARGIGCDPSYITALVDDLDERGLARREPAPDDRRVKIIVLTDAGRALASGDRRRRSRCRRRPSRRSRSRELRQLRDLLDKVVARGGGASGATGVGRLRPVRSRCRRRASSMADGGRASSRMCGDARRREREPPCRR